MQYVQEARLIFIFLDAYTVTLTSRQKLSPANTTPYCCDIPQDFTYCVWVFTEMRQRDKNKAPLSSPDTSVFNFLINH